MKRITFIVLLVLLHTVSFAAPKDKEEYKTLDAYRSLDSMVQEFKGDKSFSSIVVTHEMVSLIAQSSSNSKQNSLFNLIDYLHVLVCEGGSEKFGEGVELILSKSKELKLVTQNNSGDQRVEIYFAQSDKSTPSQFLVFTQEDNSDVVVYIVGKFDIGHISGLTNLNLGL